jgi:hypothetical protein
MVETSAPSKGWVMRIYIFKSQTRKGLQAFAGDLAGSRLPQSHGPWTATGAIGPDNPPPYKFSRDAIEEAIDTEGFQLWRMVKKAEAAPDGRTGAASAPRPIKRFGACRSPTPVTRASTIRRDGLAHTAASLCCNRVYVILSSVRFPAQRAHALHLCS